MARRLAQPPRHDLPGRQAAGRRSAAASSARSSTAATTARSSRSRPARASRHSAIRCATGGCARCSCSSGRGRCSWRCATKSKRVARDRAEPVLADRAASPASPACSRPTTAAHLLDDGDYDGVLVAVWAFLAGGIYGAFGVLRARRAALRRREVLGSQGTLPPRRGTCSRSPPCRSRCRSSLWPVKLALYGERRLPQRRQRLGRRRDASSTCSSSGSSSGRRRCS